MPICPTTWQSARYSQSQVPCFIRPPGGIAYVYDINGDFKSKCNPEMVELLPLEKQQDLDEVQKLLEEFVEYTG